MKGVSPLIAVMVLITITLGISYIVWSWVIGFALQERKISEFCRAEKILIRSGVYDINKSSLILVVENYGKKDVEFVVFLQYFNRTLHPNITDIYPEAFHIKKKSLKTIEMNDIKDDLSTVTIQSIACKGAQSMLRDVDIYGLRKK